MLMAGGLYLWCCGHYQPLIWLNAKMTYAIRRLKTECWNECGRLGQQGKTTTSERSTLAGCQPSWVWGVLSEPTTKSGIFLPNSANDVSPPVTNRVRPVDLLQVVLIGLCNFLMPSALYANYSYAIAPLLVGRLADDDDDSIIIIKGIRGQSTVDTSLDAKTMYALLYLKNATNALSFI